MILRINGKRAVIKRGSSFEYVSENRLFTDADAYTLAIELPLKDCPQNLEIFGHINRKDVPKNTNLMACELRSGSFHKMGSIAITEINDIYVKVQFLEGRSAQNCSADFDSIYINELELGYNTYTQVDGDEDVVSWTNWKISNFSKTIKDGQVWQALPWVNNYSGNIQNKIIFPASGVPVWEASAFRPSYQCYLFEVARRIFKAVGYQANMDAWMKSPYYYLLCCNTLPSAWKIMNYAKALPHWTVTEFIEQLELLMGCEFDVNHNNKHISMQFSSDAVEKAGMVLLEDVLDDFTVSQQEESSCKYKEQTNLRYASCDHEIWKYYDCPWLITRANDPYRKEQWLNQVNCSTIDNLLARVPATQYDSAEKVEDAHFSAERGVFYVQSINRYFTGRRLFVLMSDPGTPSSGSRPGTNPTFMASMVLQPLNTFGPYIEDENAETTELKIVPAWLDNLGDATKGNVLFLDCGELDNVPTNNIRSLLENGEEEQQQQFFDKIYVGFFTGETVSTKYPHPFLDEYDINTDRAVSKHIGYSLALRNSVSSTTYKPLKKVNRAFKYKFSFLSDELPDVRSTFIIRGRRFLCEKITATFTEEGMSQLMKGEFYETL